VRRDVDLLALRLVGGRNEVERSQRDSMAIPPALWSTSRSAASIRRSGGRISRYSGRRGSDEKPQKYSKCIRDCAADNHCAAHKRQRCVGYLRDLVFAVAAM
jgi:hypothetical protein